MAVIFQQDNNYFGRPVRTIADLCRLFDNFDAMAGYLTRELTDRLVGTDSFDPQKIKNETVRKVVDFIRLHFSQEISFQDICQQFHISPSYLSQLFQKETGTTFTAYLTQLRILHAERLLATTALPISEVSAQVGFHEFCYFSKIFKKQPAVTPSQYRENAGREASLNEAPLPPA